jgi:hypothetical protein
MAGRRRRRRRAARSRLPPERKDASDDRTPATQGGRPLGSICPGPASPGRARAPIIPSSRARRQGRARPRAPRSDHTIPLALATHYRDQCNNTNPGARRTRTPSIDGSQAGRTEGLAAGLREIDHARFAGKIPSGQTFRFTGRSCVATDLTNHTPDAANQMLSSFTRVDEANAALLMGRTEEQSGCALTHRPLQPLFIALGYKM